MRKFLQAVSEESHWIDRWMEGCTQGYTEGCMDGWTSHTLRSLSGSGLFSEICLFKKKGSDQMDQTKYMYMCVWCQSEEPALDHVQCGSSCHWLRSSCGY